MTNHGGKREPGPGKALGRPSQPGIERVVKMRFTADEYREVIENTTPRQRTEIIVAWLDENKNA